MTELFPMASFFSSLEIINIVIPHPKISLWIAASVGDAAANPNNIKTLLANDFKIFFIKDNPVFCNGHKSLPKSMT